MRDITESVLIGINSGAYGSGQALTSVHALPVYDADYNPEFNKADIKESRGFAGGNISQITDAHQMIKFKVLLRGSGSGNEDVPTPYAKALRLCGQAENITAATDVTYSLVDTGFEHGDIYYYIGEVLHKLTGVRGMVEFTHDIGGLDFAEFTFLGLDVPVVEAAVPAIDWSGLETMLATNAQTVSVINLLGYNISHATLKINPGQKFGYLSLSNQEEIEWEDQQGTVTIRIKEPKPSDFNFWQANRDGAQGALNFQRGVNVTDKGKILVHSCPNVQITDVKRAKDKGTLFLDISANIVPLTRNAGWSMQTR